MNTAYLVLLILLIIYVPIWIWVWRCKDQAAKYHLVKYGPCIMIKTHLGIKSMDKLARFPRFWRVFGFVSKLVSAILFFLMMYMLVVAVIALPSKIGSGGMGIEYALAIPGFNPMLPLTYGIVALFLAMIVHEMGHGIQARANDCKVDSTGLLLLAVPLGAFCEPNEAQLTKMTRRPQMDVYAAGITVNTFVAIISFVLMVLLLSTVTVSDSATSIYDDDMPGIYYIDAESPAYYSEIPTSSLITGVMPVGSDIVYDVHSVVSQDTRVSYEADIPFSPTELYYLEYQTKDGLSMSTIPIQLGVFIKTVTNFSPASEAGMVPTMFLYSITIDGEEQTISNVMEFLDCMSLTRPGDVAIIKTVPMAIDGEIGEIVEYELTLASKGDIGYLGISVTDSGFTFTTPSIMLDKAVDPFIGCVTPLDYVQGLFSYIGGPFNGLDPISSEITWWYDTSFGETTWVVVKQLYWIFWLDILLAISNALPAYPFDGGFLFEGGINWLLEKLGYKDEEKRKKVSDSVSNSVSTVVLFMFFLVLLAFVI